MFISVIATIYPVRVDSHSQPILTRFEGSILFDRQEKAVPCSLFETVLRLHGNLLVILVPYYCTDCFNGPSTNQPQVTGNIIDNEVDQHILHDPKQNRVIILPKTINNYHFTAHPIAYYQDKTRRQRKPTRQPTKKWPISPQTLKFLPAYGVDDC
jgi:hypothetical protein